jgi:hypothetical protein
MHLKTKPETHTAKTNKTGRKGKLAEDFKYIFQKLIA